MTFPSALVVLLVVVGLAAVVKGSCTYGDHKYSEGEAFKSTDGCNSCGCSRGMVLCTMRACVQLPACEHGGRKYDEGEVFTSTDGCNVCTCRLGAVVCSEKACL